MNANLLLVFVLLTLHVASFNCDSVGHPMAQRRQGEAGGQVRSRGGKCQGLRAHPSANMLRRPATTQNHPLTAGLWQGCFSLSQRAS